MIAAEAIVIGVDGQDGAIMPEISDRAVSAALIFNQQSEGLDATFTPRSLIFSSGGVYEIWSGYSIEQCYSLRKANELRVDVR